MEDSIDIIQNDGNMQKLHSLLIILMFAITNLFLIIFPFLIRKPYFLCKVNDDYNQQFGSCQEYLFCNDDNITFMINTDNNLYNWAYEFSLFCNKNGKIFFTIYNIGGLLSAFIFSYIGDLYGRKILFKYLAIAFMLINLLIYVFIFNEYLIYVLVFILGISSFLSILSSVMVTEFLSRNNAGFYICLSISSSYFLGMIAILLIIYLKNTNAIFVLKFLISIPICFLIYFFFTESTFWLVSRNRINECFDILKLIAERNKRLEEYESISRERYGTDRVKLIEDYDSILNLLNYDSQKKKILAHSLLWLISSFGFIWIHKNLMLIKDLNFTQKFFFEYFICFVIQVISGIVIDKFGRLSLITLCCYICGGITFFYALFPSDLIIKRICLFLDLIPISALNSILFCFTNEDFPTLNRCTIMGTMFFISRVIFVLIYSIMEKDILSVNLIFAVLSLIGGRFSESLEDSKDYVLEEVVYEKRNELAFKKKNYRMHRKNIKSACSDIYFLTSDDESFNKNQIYI